MGENAEDPEREYIDAYREHAFRTRFNASHQGFLNESHERINLLLAIDAIVSEVRHGE